MCPISWLHVVINYISMGANIELQGGIYVNKQTIAKVVNMVNAL